MSGGQFPEYGGDIIHNPPMQQLPQKRDLLWTALNSRDSYIAVANHVAARLKRKNGKLTEGEFRFLVNEFKELNPRQFKKYQAGEYSARSPDEIRNIVAENLYRRIKGATQTSEQLDMHEVMRSRIGTTGEIAANPIWGFTGASAPSQTSIIEQEDEDIDAGGASAAGSAAVSAASAASGQVISYSGESFESIAKRFNAKDAFGLLRTVNPDSLVRDAYIYVDSRYRENAEYGKSFQTIQWTLMFDPSTLPGVVNTVAPIRDIIQIEMWDFVMPYIEAGDTANRRITVLINEFNTQSFVCHENRQFHFVFRTSILGNRIRLDSIGRTSRAQFNYGLPLTKWDHINLTFAAPLLPITFDSDRMFLTPTFGANPALFTTVGAIDHNLISNDIIMFETFVTSDDTANAALIAQITRPEGWACTVMTASQFTCPFSLVGVLPPAAGSISCQVFFQSKRIEIPIHIKYIQANPSDDKY
jgi:hypothetical protein